VRKDLVYFLAIYLVAFGIVLGYGLTHSPVNDGVKEYLDYQDNIKNGWQFRYTLVNSCLVTTWLPAMIQKYTHVDQMFIFRLVPALFYPLMPAFTYLILRRYMVVGYALIGTLIVLLNSHFIYFPDMGRVGVAVAFLAGMIWALLEKRLMYAIVFSTLLVFAHYGTSLIAIGLVGSVFVAYYVWQHKLLKQYVTVFVVLVILVGVWHFGVAKYSGKIMGQAILQTQQVGQILPVNPDISDIQTREPAVQAAIGINDGMSTPQVLEIIFNWLVVLMITFGGWCVLRNRKIDKEFKLITLALFILIGLTVIIPTLSTYYGGMRVYFTATSVLSTSYILGSEKVADYIHVSFIVLAVVILALYGLSTSGIIYLPFGLEKTFPVVLELK
jgi:hypothetical protein